MTLIQKSLKRVLVLSCRNKWTHFFKVGRMMISVKLMWKSQKQHWQYVQSNWSLGFCRNNYTILDKELTSDSKKRSHICYCIQKQMCSRFHESDYITILFLVITHFIKKLIWFLFSEFRNTTLLTLKKCVHKHTA